MDKRRYRELERIWKGVANHRRMQIIDWIDTQTEEPSLLDIAEHTAIDFRTVGEHVRKLTAAGLTMKRHEGATVRHALTRLGKTILKFCRTLE